MPRRVFSPRPLSLPRRTIGAARRANFSTRISFDSNRNICRTKIYGSVLSKFCADFLAVPREIPCNVNER
jgi:hypothetical protein